MIDKFYACIKKQFNCGESLLNPRRARALKHYLRSIDENTSKNLNKDSNSSKLSSSLDSRCTRKRSNSTNKKPIVRLWKIESTSLGRTYCASL